MRRPTNIGHAPVPATGIGEVQALARPDLAEHRIAHCEMGVQGRPNGDHGQVLQRHHAVSGNADADVIAGPLAAHAHMEAERREPAAEAAVQNFDTAVLTHLQGRQRGTPRLDGVGDVAPRFRDHHHPRRRVLDPKCVVRKRRGGDRRCAQ